jgi:sterol desaturase/sphingolipid hydroxylase (fatty acid hydroxylase superfamily)
MNIEEFVIRNELSIRLGFFFGIFITVALWELASPRRTLALPRKVRWFSNIGLTVLNSLILRLLFPTAAIGVAIFASEQGIGLLNYYQFSAVFSIVLSLILMDAMIYFQHVIFHAIPAFWRIHRVHHADMDYDLTTGARFHPLEIILSMLFKFITIISLGPPIVAVVIFEIMLNGLAMFNHGNLRLPKNIDALLRKLLVTPDMHRVHHSVREDEANSNFGFNLSIWDRLFGTYIAEPAKGHVDMPIGIQGLRNPHQTNHLPGMLAMPFVGKITGYAINRRNWQSSGNDQQGKSQKDNLDS